MKTAEAGRMLFYHCTDRVTADRITRQGFGAGPTDSYLLSLEPSPARSGTVVLRVALAEDAVHAVLNSVSADPEATGRAFVVPGDLLRTGYVSVIPAPEARRAAR